MLDIDGKPIVHEVLYFDNEKAFKKNLESIYPEIIKSSIRSSYKVEKDLKKEKRKQMQATINTFESSVQRPGSGRSALTGITGPTQTQTIITSGHDENND